MYKNQHKNFLNRRGKTENYRIFHSFNIWSQLPVVGAVFLFFYKVPYCYVLKLGKKKGCISHKLRGNERNCICTFGTVRDECMPCRCRRRPRFESKRSLWVVRWKDLPILLAASRLALSLKNTKILENNIN